MPSFVLDSGRLARAAFGRVTHGGLSEEVCRTVREGVVDLLDQPLFPVAWDNGEPPVLTAMDRDSRVVSVAVVAHLGQAQMMDLLARAGRSATTPWVSIAERYDGGVPAFRRDWNAFRESLPPSVPPGPQIIVLAGALDPAVAQALPVLDGVLVRHLQVRSTETGQVMVELDDAAGLSARAAPADGRRSRRTPAGTHSPPRDEGTAVQDRASVQVDDVDQTLPRAPVRPGVPAPGRAAAPASAQREPEPAPAPATQPTPVAPPAAAAAAPTRAAPEPASNAQMPAPTARANGVGLSDVAHLVGAPVQIELRANGTPAHRATLRIDGTLVLADGSERTDLDGATRDLVPGGQGDPWQVWHFVQGGLPLADALTEARVRRDKPAPPSKRRRAAGPA